MLFGEFSHTQGTLIEQFTNVRPWTKKNSCPYCNSDITHFPRHLLRNHKDRGAVQELMTLSKNDPKQRKLLDNMRRQGNFANGSCEIRPVRRPKRLQNGYQIKSNEENGRESYVAGPDCLGFFKRGYLSRHSKNCDSRMPSEEKIREQHLSRAQLFTVCSGAFDKFCWKLRLKTEVFPIMRNDSVSKAAMEDPLICF